MIPKDHKLISISIVNQEMSCFEQDRCINIYPVSTGKNGVGELKNSECTPRGWHKVHAVIGNEQQVNSIFVGRQWTGEIYSDEFALSNPNRDWILTRIIQLDGLEPGRNQGGDVDTLQRYIYIHGTPDSTTLGKPGSRGCVRMKNSAIIELAQWLDQDTLVYIE